MIHLFDVAHQYPFPKLRSICIFNDSMINKVFPKNVHKLFENVPNPDLSFIAKF